MVTKFSVKLLLFVCYSLLQPLWVAADFSAEFKYNITIPANDMYFFMHDFEKGIQTVENLDEFRVSLNLSMLNTRDNALIDIFVLNETQFECYKRSYKSRIVDRCDIDYLNSNVTNLTFAGGPINFSFYRPGKPFLSLNSSGPYYVVLDNTPYPSFDYNGKSYNGAFHNGDVNLVVQIIKEMKLSQKYYTIFISLTCSIVIITLSMIIFLVIFCLKYRRASEKNKKLRAMIYD